jgi:hypothetical protein
MLSAEAMIGLAALVVMCLPALGYVLRVYSRRISSSNSQGNLIFLRCKVMGFEFELTRIK